MRKRVALFLVGLMVMIAIAGCGSPSPAQSETPSGSEASKQQEAENPAAESEASTAAEAEFTLRIAHEFSLDAFMGQCMTKLGDLITEHSNGRIACEYYPAGQLGDKRSNMEGLRSGTVDLTEGASTDVSSFVSRWSAFSLPFMYTSEAEAYKVFTNEDVFGTLDKDCEGVGMKLIALMNAGSRSMINSKRPINEPADCKGLKVRSLQDKYIARGMELMGLSPVALGWSEVYPALQQGTIDGADNSATYIADGGFYEICKYYSITEAIRLPDPVLMSRAFYDSLPEDLQEAVDEAGKEFMEWQWDFYREYEQKSLDLLVENGVEINEITPENHQKFVDVTAPVYEELFEEIPEARELYELFEAAK